jgi:hypothetical protein
VLRAVVWALAVLLALCVAALLLERRLLPAGEAGGALSAPGGQSPVLQAPQGPFEGAEERLCPVFPIEEQEF